MVDGEHNVVKRNQIRSVRLIRPKLVAFTPESLAHYGAFHRNSRYRTKADVNYRSSGVINLRISLFILSCESPLSGTEAFGD